MIGCDPTHATRPCDGLVGVGGLVAPVVTLELGGQVVSAAARAWLGMCPRRQKQAIAAAQNPMPVHLAVCAYTSNIRKNDISKNGTTTCDRAWRGAAAYTHAP